MKVFSRIGFGTLNNYPDLVKVQLKHFYQAAKKYAIDEGMKLYRVPWNTEVYELAKAIKSKLNEVGGDYFELVEKEFSSIDYDMAVAYCVQFAPFIYTYGDVIASDFYVLCCKDGSVYKEQNKNFLVPKSSFRNKDYGILSSWKYAVNEKVKEEIIEAGATNDDFLPVLTKKGEVVCYQIEPVNTVWGMSEINNWHRESGCSKCGYPIYREPAGEALTITERLLNELLPLNKTGELIGDSCLPEYIIHKELYKRLHAKYPRMNFEPIFLRNAN